MSKDQKNKPTPKSISDVPFKYDEYWMERGKTFIDETLPNLEKKANSYAIFLDTVSGVTLLGGLSLTVFLESKNALIFFLMFIPIVFLQLAKYIVKVGNKPVILSTLDPRKPVAVERVHNKIIKELSANLDLSKKIIFISVVLFTFCYPIGIYLHNVSKSDKSDYVTIVKNNNEIQISGYLTGTEKLQINLNGSIAQSQCDTVLVRNLSIKKDSVFSIHYHLDLISFRVDEVELRYKDKMLFKKI